MNRNDFYDKHPIMVELRKLETNQRIGIEDLAKRSEMSKEDVIGFVQMWAAKNLVRNSGDEVWLDALQK